MTEIPIGLLDTTIAIVAGALFTLVGIIYKKLNDRIGALEETIAELESAVLKSKRDINTSHNWMFGREQDVTNQGISAKIRDIQYRLENVIDELHDEDEIEFDRKDIED